MLYWDMPKNTYLNPILIHAGMKANASRPIKSASHEVLSLKRRFCFSNRILDFPIGISCKGPLC